jgi:hypothetical protein
LQGFMSVLIKTLQVFHLIFIYYYLLINDLYLFKERLFNKALYALTTAYYSAVIARSVTTKQSIKEHGNWIASSQAVRNDVSINR